jgi:hypothetical protein
MADFSTPRGAVPTAQSLSAVTATGAGAVFNYGQLVQGVSLQTLITGAPASLNINLEGSLDGVNFVTMTSSTSTTGEVKSDTTHLVQYVRANLTALTGGTSPTVTATIGAIQQ